MELTIIRHAHAVAGKDDAARPLSAKGRRQIKEMAAFLQRGRGLKAVEVWHSPLVRARETAERLVDRLASSAKLVEVGELNPDMDPAVLTKRMAKARRPIAVVGHEPHLSALATLLLTGRTRPVAVALRKGAVATFERKGRRWMLHWLVSPREI
jgi:phosphohistidine phosphatase